MGGKGYANETVHYGRSCLRGIHYFKISNSILNSLFYIFWDSLESVILRLRQAGHLTFYKHSQTQCVCGMPYTHASPVVLNKKLLGWTRLRKL